MVSRQEREVAALERSDDTKGSLVEGEQPTGADAVRQDDQRGVSESDAQVAVALDDTTSGGQLTLGEALDEVGPRDEVVEEGQLHIRAQAVEYQVVRPGHRQLGRDEGFSLLAQDRRDGSMSRFIGVSLSIKSARVDHERHQPSPIVRRYRSAEAHGT